MFEFYPEPDYLWEDNHHSVTTAVKFFPVSFKITTWVFLADFYRPLCFHGADCIRFVSEE
jgi:hypothetical protein